MVSTIRPIEQGNVNRPYLWKIIGLHLGYIFKEHNFMGALQITDGAISGNFVITRKMIRSKQSNLLLHEAQMMPILLVCYLWLLDL